MAAVAVVAAVVCIVQAVRFAPVPDPPQAEELSAAPEPLHITSARQTPPSRWTVSIWQGRVAVFEGADTQPIRVLETPVSALPPYDQQTLEAGIPVDDPVVLAGILEDYGS